MSGKQIDLARGYWMQEPVRGGTDWRVMYGELDTGLRISPEPGSVMAKSFTAFERTVREMLTGSPTFVQELARVKQFIGGSRTHDAGHPTCLNCGHTHYYDMDGDAGDAIGNPTGSCRLGCGCQLARYAPTAGI
jgi:hypothetical protein